MQPNRLFDTREEIDAWLAQNFKGAKVVKVWEVKSFACVIEMEKK